MEWICQFLIFWHDCHKQRVAAVRIQSLCQDFLLGMTCINNMQSIISLLYLIEHFNRSINVAVQKMDMFQSFPDLSRMWINISFIILSPNPLFFIRAFIDSPSAAHAAAVCAAVFLVLKLHCLKQQLDSYGPFARNPTQSSSQKRRDFSRIWCICSVAIQDLRIIKNYVEKACND